MICTAGYETNGTVRIFCSCFVECGFEKQKHLSMDDNCNRNYRMLNVQSQHTHNMELPMVASTHDTVGRTCSPLNSGVDSKINNFIFTQEQVECVCEVSVKLNAIPLSIYVILNIDNFINTFNLSFSLSAYRREHFPHSKSFWTLNQ